MFDYHLAQFNPFLYEVVSHVDIFYVLRAGFLPFFSNSTALMLSWYWMFLSIPCPFASKKYHFYIICEIALSAPITSATKYLFVFNLCFFSMLIIHPCLLLPIDIFPPVCPRMSSCAAYDTSTHHFTTFTSLAHIISGSLIFHLGIQAAFVIFSSRPHLSSALTLLGMLLSYVHPSCI